MYLPHTIYSKPERLFKEYTNTVMVVFHGFLSAMPNHFFKVLNQVFGATITVIGYNYDYFDVIQNKHKFDQFYKAALINKTLYFAGTSLGGFWAQHFADVYQADHVILSNPVVNPSQVLSFFLDKDNFSDRRRQTITVTREKLNRYEPIVLNQKFKGRRLVLLSENDDVQDYAIAQDFFKDGAHTRILTFKQGGHAIDLTTHTSALTAIETFVAYGR